MPYLPRLGKIRLGIKCVSKKTGKEYPKEVEYFVCPPEVQKVYGERPVVLDVMFPSENQADVIPYCYKSYGSNQKLKCKGDGETATWFNPETKEMEEKKCPCEELESRIEEKKLEGKLVKVKVGPSCAKRGHLMVILPKISLGGVYQIDTGSGVNINRILDAIDYWKGMVGRCKCIPLTLERVPEKVTGPDGKMQPHYLFRFSSKVNVDSLNQAIEDNRKILAVEYKVEKPIEEGKLDDTPIEMVEEAEVIEDPKRKITEDERAKMFEVLRDSGQVSIEDLQQYLKKKYKIIASENITLDIYQGLLDWIKDPVKYDTNREG